METFRRLDDSVTYYGLSWRGWLAVAVAGGLLYGFVRASPFDTRATLSVALIACVLPAMAAFASSGHALGPGRYLVALISWALRSKEYAPRSTALPDGGVMIDGPLSVKPTESEVVDWTDGLDTDDSIEVTDA
jgi:hypothetical protein